MDRGVDDQRGGILGLVQFLTDYGEAVEYHLIDMGLRLRWLGTDLLTWSDLHAIIRGAPSSSAIGRELAGPGAAWSLLEHLTAVLIDAVNMGNWQRQGDPYARRPDPIKRPGADTGGMHIGREPIPISEFAAWWDAA